VDGKKVIIKKVGTDTRFCLTVTGGGSIGECGRLSRPIWVLSTL